MALFEPTHRLSKKGTDCQIGPDPEKTLAWRVRYLVVCPFFTAFYAILLSGKPCQKHRRIQDA